MSVLEIVKLNPQKIVISSGSASLDDVGITLEVIEYFKDKVPILGIFLCHQTIAQVFGVDIVRTANMIEGETSLKFINIELCM